MARSLSAAPLRAPRSRGGGRSLTWILPGLALGLIALSAGTAHAAVIGVWWSGRVDVYSDKGVLKFSNPNSSGGNLTNSLAQAPDGTVYTAGLTCSNTPCSFSRLYTIDVATGATTPGVSIQSAADIRGLAAGTETFQRPATASRSRSRDGRRSGATTSAAWPTWSPSREPS